MPAAPPIFISTTIVKNDKFPSACIYVIVQHFAHYGIRESFDSFISCCKVAHRIPLVETCSKGAAMPEVYSIFFDSVPHKIRQKLNCYIYALSCYRIQPVRRYNAQSTSSATIALPTPFQAVLERPSALSWTDIAGIINIISIL